jgi:hypothetical protein
MGYLRLEFVNGLLDFVCRDAGVIVRRDADDATAPGALDEVEFELVITNVVVLAILK